VSKSSTTKLTAGCAVIDITPPVGVELSGWAFGPSEGVLHPLSARALFLDDGSTRLILISADVIGFDTFYADEIRSAIAKACELDVGGVMLAGTHTHSGPATAFYRNWGKPDPDYRARLKTQLVDLAQDALKRTFEARMGTGLAFVRGLASNRVVAGGATDPEVGLVRVDDADGKTRAALLTCGCHPVNLHNYKKLFTPDFPWFTRRWLKQELGDDLTVLFFASPFGDQNPANFRRGDPEAEAEETGEKLARDAFETFKAIETSPSVHLQQVTAEVALPLQPLPEPAEIERELEAGRLELAGLEGPHAPLHGLAVARTRIEWAEEALAARQKGREKTEQTMVLQAFHLGDAAFLAIPAEVFVGVGSSIRDGSPFYRTFLATQANGTVGYIPTADAFQSQSYEAVRAPRIYGLQAFQPDVSRAVVNGAKELLHKLPCEAILALPSRNPRSRELRRRALELVVGGCQAHKAPLSLDLGAPAFVERARGAHFWDVDGNEYIDFLMSYGPIVLGHNYPAVDDAIKRQMEKGTIFDVEYPEMLDLTEKLIELIPCAEMAAYFVGGSGATSGAVAMARSHTGRDKIIRSGYHGWHPWTQSGARGTPKCYGELTLSHDYNDLDQLESLLKENRGEVAGAIIESVQGDGPKEGYFEGVRRLLDEHGAVFILDEVKTGFRFDLGGAQKYFGIEPDLATFGKALCNGYPGAVVVGKREIIGPRTDTWLAATFHADAISVAAALATVAELERCDGIAHQWRLGQRLKDGLDDIFKRAGVGLHVQGYPCLASVGTSESGYGRLCQRFMQALMVEGVYLTGHPWFLCLSHTDADIDQSLEKAETALRKALA